MYYGTVFFKVNAIAQNSFQYGDKVPIYLAIEIGELEFAQVFTLQEGNSVWEKLVLVQDA